MLYIEMECRLVFFVKQEFAYSVEMECRIVVLRELPVYVAGTV